jgi:hypothetical protein
MDMNEKQQTKLLEITLLDLSILEKIVKSCPFRFYHRIPTVEDLQSGNKAYAHIARQVKDELMPSGEEIVRALEIIEQLNQIITPKN